MLKKFKKRAAKLFVSLLLFLPLLNDASAASDNLSYDVLSQQFIQAPADFLVPFSKKLYSFCLAKQILEKIESKKTELNSTIKITPEILSGVQSKKGILLGADKEISVKELLRALIFLQAPEANKIALHWLETLSGKKEEQPKLFFRFFRHVQCCSIFSIRQRHTQHSIFEYEYFSIRPLAGFDYT